MAGEFQEIYAELRVQDGASYGQMVDWVDRALSLSPEAAHRRAERYRQAPSEVVVTPGSGRSGSPSPEPEPERERDPEYVYRAVSEDDLMDLEARGKILPKGEGHDRVAHVQGKSTAFLSGSLIIGDSRSGAAKFDSGFGIIKINVELLYGTGSDMVGHSALMATLRADNRTRDRDITNATNAKEVLISGGIDADAIEDYEGIPPEWEDVFN